MNQVTLLAFQDEIEKIALVEAYSAFEKFATLQGLDLSKMSDLEKEAVFGTFMKAVRGTGSVLGRASGAVDDAVRNVTLGGIKAVNKASPRAASALLGGGATRAGEKALDMAATGGGLEDLALSAVPKAIKAVPKIPQAARSAGIAVSNASRSTVPATVQLSEGARRAAGFRVPVNITHYGRLAPTPT